MGSLQGIRLQIKRVYIVLGVSFVLLLISFVFHVIKINKFNALERYDTPDTVSMEQMQSQIHVTIQTKLQSVKKSLKMLMER